MSLPELVVFSVRDSNDARYLSFTGPQRQLRFGPEEGVFSDLARFAVESAGNGLVHIRSCYENNYWARASRPETWLVASAPEKVEDMSKDGCTLFRPRLSAGNVFVEFIHAQSGLNVVMRPPNDAHAYSLCIEHGAPTEFSLTDFAVISRTRLPRYVMFLGDNNKYLSSIKLNENNGYVHVRQYEFPTNREVLFEVLYNKSGDKLRLKSMSMNDFCGVSLPHTTVYIRPLPENDPGTLFDATLYSPPNTTVPGIVLRSLVNNRYCRRSPAINQELTAESNSLNDLNAWLRPMPPSLYRVNIESFRKAWRGPNSSRVVKEVRIENRSNSVMERDNESVEYIMTTINSYSNSMFLVRGSAVFNGRIPKVGSNGELEIPNAVRQVNTSWATPSFDQSAVKQDLKLKVPPMSIMVATVSVITVTYEVPFSYQQIDVFHFDGPEPQYLHGGVFKTESDYSAVTYDIQPLTSEGMINAIDDGIEPNASDEVKQE
ncbi:uncharacterized protein LOC141610531 [Silene latifolia]|uniref:uncharacterized protein LOC141610531 n=1 Tax=Silene latifolia TaxID=37657 RepID=UPI003D776236